MLPAPCDRKTTELRNSYRKALHSTSYMNSSLRIRLETTPAQHVKLLELQGAFAAVCNALAPVVQSTGCWNRVALHHLAYKAMRQQFPALGSQMICNALYSAQPIR